jgi:DNA-binding NtrC family response regulator
MNHKHTILVVDDELPIADFLEERLTLENFRVFTAIGVIEAFEILNNREIDLVISDMKMPNLGGMDLLREINMKHPGLPVIFMTAYATIPDTVHAIKSGAADYITKPFDSNDLIKKVNEVLKTDSYPIGLKKTSHLSEAVFGGESSSMKSLHKLVNRIIPSDINVLIVGESGVGKELIARLIHERGSRNKNPLVVVDCGSTPEGLLETELFGHVRGAFTHAIRDKKGLIEAADGSTLFLDEIGNISMGMQARLLRFLEERKIRKVGELDEMPVDCRVISATNLDLVAEVEAGRFREDLYYRLRVVTLRVPPLRERKEDIPLLAQRFVEEFCDIKGCPTMTIPEETIEWLCRYPWPGNVRELKNALEGAVTLCKNDTLHISDIKLTGVLETSRLSRSITESLSLEKNERALIIRALEKAQWVQKDAARLLGISRRVIYYKIKKFGIEPPMEKLKSVQ